MALVFQQWHQRKNEYFLIVLSCRQAKRASEMIRYHYFKYAICFSVWWQSSVLASGL